MSDVKVGDWVEATEEGNFRGCVGCRGEVTSVAPGSIHVRGVTGVGKCAGRGENRKCVFRSCRKLQGAGEEGTPKLKVGDWVEATEEGNSSGCVGCRGRVAAIRRDCVEVLDTTGASRCEGVKGNIRCSFFSYRKIVEKPMSDVKVGDLVEATEEGNRPACVGCRGKVTAIGLDRVHVRYVIGNPVCRGRGPYRECAYGGYRKVEEAETPTSAQEGAERTCAMSVMNRRVEYVLAKRVQETLPDGATKEDVEPIGDKRNIWTNKDCQELREELLFKHHEEVAEAGGPSKVEIKFPPFK